VPERSLVNADRKIDNNQQTLLPLDGGIPVLGGINDDLLVRDVITDAIKRSGKSRQQVADEMSALLGTEVTDRMLNSFTASSREQHRWPGAWDRAFCMAAGDDRLLTCRVELAGYKVIRGDEVHLLELGRQYLLRKRSEAELADLERRLEGSAL
jgi:hypothetical protein